MLSSTKMQKFRFVAFGPICTSVHCIRRSELHISLIAPHCFENSTSVQKLHILLKASRWFKNLHWFDSTRTSHSRVPELRSEWITSFWQSNSHLFKIIFCYFCLTITMLSTSSFSLLLIWLIQSVEPLKLMLQTPQQ